MYCQSSYRYTLFLGIRDGRNAILRKEQNGVPVNFSKPVTVDKHPKIYVLKVGDELVYIGYTGQGIRARLDGGLRAKGENGYHGYKWQNEKVLDLLVFMFEPFTEDADSNDEYKLFVEAIEAELVYLVREKTGNWPRCQNEIHFNNERREEVKKIAGEIYDIVSQGSTN